ncbi:MULTISPECIES: exosporium leader peptide-containing protein [Bacillus]|uniref:exosporium leader peptide-containing protein n=1 Tax=Bacillus TaxID=1386 RepID=UPI000B44432E|nr:MULTISPECIES: exosporium leader peptide-containing protein [Bacillus]OUB90726.1 exosporium leader peptide [Bacillus thuringiensis serovar sinensis]MBY7112933.1 exosporium leader peptide-containing protein [Bacillus sp. 17RED48]MCU5599023.1 exosporium leader peptide-containing protein [Bacillus wiedmannii]MRS27623.1 exosporium leader peptide-containing protein [Bacillus sp. RIT694]HDR7783244.1 exosporium leader peptide-containing protein [Bacillus wiedmannii]
MDEFLSSTSINPNLVGPTLPPVPPFTLPTGPTGPTGSLSVAYGTFWQTEIITVPFESPFSFNQADPMVGGISLLNPTTINIKQAGDYRISFISSINLTVALSFPYSPTISILLNNSLIPNFKATFGLSILDPEDVDCAQLIGDTILSVPANSTLQLINNSFVGETAIRTCDNGINALELNIIKLN